VSEYFAGLQNVPALATGLLMETSRLMAGSGDPVTIVWHTFEQERWRPAGMTSGDPRRHWRATVPLGAPPISHETADPLSSIYDHVLEFSFLVDRLTHQIVATPDVIHTTGALLGLTEAEVATAIFSSP